ncbi:MAG: hypothetical protein HYW49_07035, partial [Deltaproteobacteria bacterium]|nr:hypothetical protein [Deltaproteobacteria bacterium]
MRRIIALAMGFLMLFACTNTNKQPEVSELSLISQFPIEGMPDPRKISTAADWLISTHLWARLVQLGELGQEAPDLAKRWIRSVDGLKWTFEFDNDLKWSDGTSLSTDQIANSLNISILGTAHTNLKSYVKKIYASDSTHIVFELTALPQNFLYSLAFADFAITDGTVKTDAKQNTRFSGPYKLTTAKTGEVQLETNLYYIRPKGNRLKARIRSATSSAEFVDSILRDKVGIGFISSDIIDEEQERRLVQAGYKIHVTSPEWTVALEVGKKALKRKNTQVLRLLQNLLWTRLGHSTDFGSLPATGLRPPFSFGGLNESEWKSQITLATGHPEDVKKFSKIDLMVRKIFLNSKSYRAVHKTFTDLGLTINEIIYDPEKRDSIQMKQLREQAYDFWFVYEGVNDPDPDSAWRYMMDSYPGEKKLVTKEELDKALLEPDRKKR